MPQITSPLNIGQTTSPSPIKKPAGRVHLINQSANSGLIATAAKVGSYAAWAFVHLVIFALTAGIGTALLAAKRIKSHRNTKGTIESLGVSRSKILQATMEEIGTGKSVAELKGTEKEKARFRDSVSKLKELIKEGPSKGYAHDHMQKVREKIDKALQSPVYADNKDNAEDVDIYTLHMAAHVLTARAEGMGQLEAHGEKATEGKDTTYKGLAKALDNAVEKHVVFHRETVFEKVVWGLTHPDKSIAVFLDEKSVTPALAYNSYQNGNANIRVGAFRVGNMKMHLTLGPTPTSDRLFQAHLQHLKNEGKGQIHFQQDLESPTKKAEAKRRFVKKEIADAHLERMLYMSTPMDGEIWKSKGAYDQSDPIEFLEVLRGDMGSWSNADQYTQMQNDPKKDNGFYIPKSIADSGRVQLLIAQTMNSFRAVKIPEELTAQQVNKAALLGIEAALAMEAIFKAAERSGTESIDYFMGQACKQDIDRGVILNVMTILYFDALSKTPLTEERIHQIVGMTLMRADMVDDRAILHDRYEALSSLLKIIAVDPDAYFAPLRSQFQGKFPTATNTSFETVKS